jgi:hypothetical protein
MTHEELLEECRKILETGRVETPRSWTSTDGTFPLNCDIDEDIALVTVVTSAPDKGVYYSEECVFERISGVWEYLGGRAASMDFPTPVRGTRAELGGTHLRLTGHGLTRRRRPALFPDKRWISTAELQASDEVASLHLDDREIEVPPHGFVSVIWHSLRPARITALDPDAKPLVSLDLNPRTWFEAPDG